MTQHPHLFAVLAGSIANPPFCGSRRRRLGRLVRSRNFASRRSLVRRSSFMRRRSFVRRSSFVRRRDLVRGSRAAGGRRSGTVRRRGVLHGGRRCRLDDGRPARAMTATDADSATNTDSKAETPPARNLEAKVHASVRVEPGRRRLCPSTLRVSHAVRHRESDNMQVRTPPSNGTGDADERARQLEVDRRDPASGRSPADAAAMSTMSGRVVRSLI